MGWFADRRARRKALEAAYWDAYYTSLAEPSLQHYHEQLDAVKASGRPAAPLDRFIHDHSAYADIRRGEKPAYRPNCLWCEELEFEARNA